MGAVPERDGRAVVTLIREAESRTQTITAISGKPGPRRFTRVPTHAVGVAEERRRYPRASLCLPLRLTKIAGVEETIPITLVTRNISSSGVYFLAPRVIEPGTAIELQVALIERPLGFGSVQMCTAAHIVRAEDTSTPGWRAYAASFDDFALERDDRVPQRFVAR
jgi:PilZ domain